MTNYERQQIESEHQAAEDKARFEKAAAFVRAHGGTVSEIHGEYTVQLPDDAPAEIVAEFEKLLGLPEPS